MEKLWFDRLYAMISEERVDGRVLVLDVSSSTLSRKALNWVFTPEFVIYRTDEGKVFVTPYKSLYDCQVRRA